MAALQVLAMHCASAFLPAIGMQDPQLASHRWERWFIQTPLFWPIDGYSAVFIFFLISGAALTYAFGTQPFPLAQNMGRRLVRLGVPMMVALLFGATLLAILPDAHVGAAVVTGSERWLGVFPDKVTLAGLSHQLAFDGLLTGYGEFSVLPDWLVQSAQPVASSQSFNPPLWTLHIEFYGSVVVLGLVALGAVAGRAVGGAASVVFIVVFARSPLMLFAVGHLVAPWLLRARASRAGVAAGILCCLIGVLACTVKDYGPGLFLYNQMLPVPWGMANNPSLVQSSIGAILIFLGIAMLPAVQGMLLTRSALFLGRISFALYLSHIPVLLTVTSEAFLLLSRHCSVTLSAIIAVAIGLGVTCLTTILFDRWVDKPSIRLSRMVAARRRHRDPLMV